MDDREGADEGQPKFPISREAVLRRDEMYTRDQILDRVGITSRTLLQWEREEALQCQPYTKCGYYYGGDVIDFMRKHKKGRE